MSQHGVGACALPVSLTVNAVPIVETVEPRTHLADLLRDRLGLTGTHLRCEQGACGACTVLIDGQPARSCITYAVLCDGAQITTIEGLENDPVMAALRRAFASEHGLQCGFCTPGMLVTARDIVMRLPDADERRVRLELSGNLCRCTGYVGIVRAVRRVLEERRRGSLAVPVTDGTSLGPVGSQHAERMAATAARPMPEAGTSEARSAFGEAGLGLGGRKPSIEIRRSLVIERPPQEVWTFLADIERVVPCMPGAMLTALDGDRVRGRVAIKIGPIAAAFDGEARIIRDDAARRGTILGTGSDRLSGSRANAEVEYVLTPEREATAARIDMTVRAVLTGALAQFGRSGIVEDLAARLSDTFAHNLERRLAAPAGALDETSAPIAAGSLLGAVILSRMRNALARLLGKFRR
jgi:carbon-monoxide dehydrogenase small subunit